MRYLFIPLHNHPPERKGLSERLLKKRLEKQGWTVWRAGLIGITRKTDIYPNVKRKYERLQELLPDDHEYLSYVNAVHHGMPDFICERYGRFLFVECKLCHEQLLPGQKKCIKLLQERGFTVEVHKLVDYRTKIREAIITEKGKKRVSVQLSLPQSRQSSPRSSNRRERRT